jgi:hypothetical protein
MVTYDGAGSMFLSLACRHALIASGFAGVAVKLFFQVTEVTFVFVFFKIRQSWQERMVNYKCS